MRHFTKKYYEFRCAKPLYYYLKVSLRRSCFQHFIMQCIRVRACVRASLHHAYTALPSARAGHDFGLESTCAASLPRASRAWHAITYRRCTWVAVRRSIVPTGYFEVLLTRRGGYALLRLHFQNTEKLLTEYIEGSSDEKYSRKERSLFSSSGDMWVQLFR